jgi:hypothetical protein
MAIGRKGVFTTTIWLHLGDGHVVKDKYRTNTRPSWSFGGLVLVVEPVGMDVEDRVEYPARVVLRVTTK